MADCNKALLWGGTVTGGGCGGRQGGPVTPSPNLSHRSAFTFLSAALGLVDSHPLGKHAGAVCAGFSFSYFFFPPHCRGILFSLMKARRAQVTNRLVCVRVCVCRLARRRVPPEVGGRWKELFRSHSVGERLM